MADFIAVTSGKGGVGKTLVSLHLAYASNLKGKRALVIDLDLGLANVDIVLNVEPRYNIRDIIDGKLNSMDAVTKTPFGFDLLASVSGARDLANMSDVVRFQLIDCLKDLDAFYDVVVLDMGAGIQSNVTDFLECCGQVIVVTTPDPHAIADAYAMTKILSQQMEDTRVGILVNQAMSLEESRAVFERIEGVARQFLSISLNYVGGVCSDISFQRSVARQMVFTKDFLATRASYQMNQTLGSYLEDIKRLERVKVKDWSRMYNAPRQRTTNAF